MATTIYIIIRLYGIRPSIYPSVHPLARKKTQNRPLQLILEELEHKTVNTKGSRA